MWCSIHNIAMGIKGDARVMRQNIVSCIPFILHVFSIKFNIKEGKLIVVSFPLDGPRINNNEPILM
jgi:hypothetical protein